MNREIKFRMWDGHVMYVPAGASDNDFYISADGTLKMLLDPNGNGSFEPAELHGRCILMQFTGLSDKHGTPIFEGDILKEPGHTSYKFRGRGEIIYERDYGGFAVFGEWSKNQHHELLTCDIACDCEVIGNIYQHVELLKSTSRC